jgi:hypothetical protein
MSIFRCRWRIYFVKVLCWSHTERKGETVLKTRSFLFRHYWFIRRIRIVAKSAVTFLMPVRLLACIIVATHWTNFTEI